MDPTLVSRRLNIVYQEMERERTRFLDDDAVETFRNATDVLKAGQVKTFRDAVRSVLGKHVGGLHPDTTQLVIDRLDALQAQHAAILEMLETLVTSVREPEDRQAAPVTVTPNPGHDRQPLWSDNDENPTGQRY